MFRVIQKLMLFRRFVLVRFVLIVTLTALFALITLAITPAITLARPITPPAVLHIAIVQSNENANVEAVFSNAFARQLAQGLQLKSGSPSQLSTNDNEAQNFKILDFGLTRAAARGSGYKGSLNLALAEARDLGASIGCDFYVLVQAETLRRSSSAKPVYFEANAKLMFVSSLSGKLLAWRALLSEGAQAAEAERALLAQLEKQFSDYQNIIRNAAYSERTNRRAQSLQLGLPPTETPLLIDDAVTENVRVPQPFRRLRPVYTETASAFEISATVDAEVEIDLQGRVTNIEIVRWGGFGLDESVTETVKRLYFRAAQINGVNVLSRVLLRYNFRKPAK